MKINSWTISNFGIATVCIQMNDLHRGELQLNSNMQLRLKELEYAYQITQLFSHHLNMQKVAQRGISFIQIY